MPPKILFILKRREDYDPLKHNPIGLSTGLYNSASFMDVMLRDMGHESALEVAIDNNCIDRLVTKHKPTHVIIEALWVVPTKFAILSKIHPKVKWIIRLHSELPFLAGEGSAMNWLGDYVSYPNVSISANSPRMLNEVRAYLRIKKSWNVDTVNKRVTYMPNYYPKNVKPERPINESKFIDVCCFGAVRPLKNHLMQAIAAIQFADSINKTLRFHINAGRIEMNGDPVMNNLRGLFAQLVDVGHRLVGHEWTPRDEFLKLCATMDIGMQVSFSETFNIVGADIISQGVPLVGSNEIPWSVAEFNANPVDSESIYSALLYTYRNPARNVALNSAELDKYTENTKIEWNNRVLEMSNDNT